MSFGGGSGGFGAGGWSTGGYGTGGGRGNATTQLKKADFSNLPVFEKNFYVEHPAVSKRCANAVSPIGALHNPASLVLLPRYGPCPCTCTPCVSAC